MKKFLILLLCVSLLCGCSGEDASMEQALRVREVFQNHACSFLLEITAETDDALSQFSLQCESDADGNIAFDVVAPESIRGVSGRISELGGELIYDDLIYTVEPVFDESISPVLAPWLLIRGLSSGYIDAVSEYEDGIRLDIDDSYQNNVYALHIWVDKDDTPVHVDFVFDGRRVLSVGIKDMVFL